jgi:hypothetical protein
MPLPRISTNFLLSDLDIESSEEELTEIKPRYLPSVIIEQIILWNEEFKIARIKAYYYRKFMEHYGVSLVRSTSRLKLYNRELKSIGMKYRTMNGDRSFKSFVKDTQINKRKYDYDELKGIFI